MLQMLTNHKFRAVDALGATQPATLLESYNPGPTQADIGALIINIRFRGILYDNYNQEPPN